MLEAFCMAPDVSIVIPALNEEKRIKTTLEFLRKQQFEGTIEIILADGYSKDKTVEIAKSFVDKVVLEKVRRISVERQSGAKAATGKIIAFTDADSQAPNNWVQSIWNAFEKNPKASFVYGPVFVHDVPKWEMVLDKIAMKIMLQFFHWIGNFSPIGSNIALPKKVFNQIGGFDTSMVTCEDLELAKRAQKAGKLVYDSKVTMTVSARRIKEWGYSKYVWFHLTNGYKFHKTGRGRDHYEDVR
ncbi:glycosyltransferase [Candidatus Micrarchaeota archaeon]|nr:glycosyltransferase [Candidatus Micrarchaeota archaeon]